MVEYRCSHATGLGKRIRCYAGSSWIEVDLNEPATYYWDFDDPDHFAADGPSPGKFLFSGGKTGPVAASAAGVSGQVKDSGQRWAAKFLPNKMALGLVTPESEGDFVVGPGAGAGGVGIESSPAVSHFVTYGGPCGESPQRVMDSLARTLNYRNQPAVTLYATQSNPSK